MPALRISAAALALGLLLAACSSGPQTVKVASIKGDKERHVAPDFTLKDIDGKTVHLSDYKGKVVLLDFWATTCGPCRMEIPWFIELERTRKDKGFAVLGVSMDDSWDDVKPFLAEEKMNYRVVLGDDATSQRYGGVDAIPTTLLIDKKGKIAAIHIGVDSGQKDFAASVDQLLSEPGEPNREP